MKLNSEQMGFLKTKIENIILPLDNTILGKKINKYHGRSFQYINFEIACSLHYQDSTEIINMVFIKIQAVYLELENPGDKCTEIFQRTVGLLETLKAEYQEIEKREYDSHERQEILSELKALKEELADIKRSISDLTKPEVSVDKKPHKHKHSHRQQQDQKFFSPSASSSQEPLKPQDSSEEAKKDEIDKMMKERFSGVAKHYYGPMNIIPKDSILNAPITVDEHGCCVIQLQPK